MSKGIQQCGRFFLKMCDRSCVHLAFSVTASEFGIASFVFSKEINALE